MIPFHHAEDGIFEGGLFYPPTQKTTPACRNACLPTGKHFGEQARALAVGLHECSWFKGCCSGNPL